MSAAMDIVVVVDIPLDAHNLSLVHILCSLQLSALHTKPTVEQAQKLLSNATFPTESPPSNNQLLRYLYYSGRIRALRLEYTSSFSSLSQCLRKCPTNTGLGFRIAVQRLCVVVQLLMGEIPDREVFEGDGMRGEMKPYLEIARAVRKGDLAVFASTVTRHAARFRIDGTFTLISRLEHSVVKAGLRRLKTSYSRISLKDVAVRLGLPSAKSAEFIVAKAVRDGVIDATIDHEGGFVQSHDLIDVYATVEPSEAFHRRIAYCLTTHNDAVRAMRYHEDAYKRQLEASRGLKRRGEENKTDEEKAAELEDEFDEDY
jgi:26S proteasome regulatory subunit N3